MFVICSPSPFLRAFPSFWVSTGINSAGSDRQSFFCLFVFHGEVAVCLHLELACYVGIVVCFLYVRYMLRIEELCKKCLLLPLFC